MFCGKCGAEVPDGYEFCMKCGIKMDLTNTPETTKEETKKKKWLIPLIILVGVIFIACIAIYFINNQKDKDGLYNDIAWGTSLEDVKKIADKKNGDEEVSISKKNKFMLAESLPSYKGDQNLTATAVYDCSDDKFNEVTIFIINNQDSKYTDNEVYEKYLKEFKKLYGDGFDGVLGKEWTTKKSHIKWVHLGENSYILSYIDINKQN